MINDLFTIDRCVDDWMLFERLTSGYRKERQEGEFDAFTRFETCFRFVSKTIYCRYINLYDSGELC